MFVIKFIGIINVYIVLPFFDNFAKICDFMGAKKSSRFGASLAVSNYSLRLKFWLFVKDYENVRFKKLLVVCIW